MNATEASENKDLNLSNARLAYTIINGLLHHTETLSDLLALMAHALDKDVTRTLTETRQWESYIDSRRELENTKLQIEKFTEELQKIENQHND